MAPLLSFRLLLVMEAYAPVLRPTFPFSNIVRNTEKNEQMVPREDIKLGIWVKKNKQTKNRDETEHVVSLPLSLFPSISLIRLFCRPATSSSPSVSTMYCYTPPHEASKHRSGS